MKKLSPKVILESSKNIAIPKKLTMFIFSVSLLIQSVIAEAETIKSENVVDDLTEKTPEVANLKPGKDMLSSFLDLDGKDIRIISITKEELHTLYQDYEKQRGKMTPNQEALTRELLFQYYIDMFKVGYQVDGYMELQQVGEIITFLSDGKITRIEWSDVTMPDHPDFTGTLDVVGRIEGDIFIIDKEDSSMLEDNWFYNNDNEIRVESQTIEILKALESDLPNTCKQAIELRNLANDARLLLKVELDKAEGKIADLALEIKGFKLEIENKQKELKEEKERAIEKAKSEKSKAEKKLKETVALLTEEHNKALAELNSQINSKDTDYQNLQESFNSAIAKANADAQAALELADSNLKSEQTRLENLFNLEREDFKGKIKLLNDDMAAQKALIDSLEQGFETERTKFEEDIDKLKIDLTAQNEKILLLENTVGNNKIKIEGYEKEIAELKEEKEKLVTQNETEASVATNILKQTQESLKSSNDTIGSLEDDIVLLEEKIDGYELEIKALQEENSRIADLEIKAEELELALKEISLLNERINSRDSTITSLEASITTLEEENKKLQTYKTKADDYDLLMEKFNIGEAALEKSVEDSFKKQILLDGQKVTIREHNEKIISLGKEKASLQSQLDAKVEKLKELTDGTILIGDDTKSKRIGELTVELATLRKLLEDEEKQSVENDIAYKKEIERLKKEHAAEVERLILE